VTPHELEALRERLCEARIEIDNSLRALAQRNAAVHTWLKAAAELVGRANEAVSRWEADE